MSQEDSSRTCLNRDVEERRQCLIVTDGSQQLITSPSTAYVDKTENVFHARSKQHAAVSSAEYWQKL
ncbi:hypothetical protein A0H81_07643 [Grifola frondosa]|uniref:Uncharacterized protein n=1 Tax=Grifola frondosa TaxID=5627 RepID=A0A1C7M6E0_GRIFR|nr:hypothetical protein A0H81_07643 [Grifola frondosa]